MFILLMNTLRFNSELGDRTEMNLFDDLIGVFLGVYF